MYIVNENIDTRRLRGIMPTTEEGEPGGTFDVEFQENGRARVSQEVGEYLCGAYGPIRPAEGPEDVAQVWAERQEQEQEPAAEEDAAEEEADTEQAEG